MFTPDQRKNELEQAVKDKIWELVRAFDFKSDEIPKELAEMLPRGTTLYKLFPGKFEPLAMHIKHCRPDETTNFNFYGHANRLGIIGRETTYPEYCDRGIIEIYSEPHGAKIFVYDLPTRKRIYPQDVSNISDQVGDNVTGFNRGIYTAEVKELIETLLKNKKPDQK